MVFCIIIIIIIILNLRSIFFGCCCHFDCSTNRERERERERATSEDLGWQFASGCWNDYSSMWSVNVTSMTTMAWRWQYLLWHDFGLVLELNFLIFRVLSSNFIFMVSLYSVFLNFPVNLAVEKINMYLVFLVHCLCALFYHFVHISIFNGVYY